MVKVRDLRMIMLDVGEDKIGFVSFLFMDEFECWR